MGKLLLLLKTASFYVAITSVFLTTPPLGAAPLVSINQQIRKGNFQKAITDLYELSIVGDEKEQGKEPKSDLSHIRTSCRLLAEAILQHNLTSTNPQQIEAALFGYGLSRSVPPRSLLSNIFRKEIELIQISAVSLASKVSGPEVEYLLKEALRSNFLSVRMEALEQLIRKGSTLARPQLEGLYSKLSTREQVYLLPLFGIEGSKESLEHLYRSTQSGSYEVQAMAYTVLAFCKHHQDLFTPTILDPRTLEAFLYYISSSPDPKRFCQAERFKDHQDPAIRARAHAILAQRDLSSYSYLEEAARNEDLYALSVLQEIPQQGEKLLVDLLQSPKPLLRLNSALYLLNLTTKEHKAALDVLEGVLVDSSSYLRPSPSPGQTMTIWNQLPGMPPDFVQEERSFKKQKEILLRAAQLPDETFIPFAERVIKKSSRLIPLGTTCLAFRGAVEALKTISTINTPDCCLSDEEDLNLSQLYALKAYVYCTKDQKLRKKLQYAAEKLIGTSTTSPNRSPKFSPRPLIAYWTSKQATQKPEPDRGLIAQFLLETAATLIEQQDPDALAFILFLMKNEPSCGQAYLAGLLLN